MPSVFSAVVVCMTYIVCIFIRKIKALKRTTGLENVCAEKTEDNLDLSSACRQGPNFSPAWEPEIHSGHKIASLHFFSSHRRLLWIANGGAMVLLDCSSSCIHQQPLLLQNARIASLFFST